MSAIKYCGELLRKYDHSVYLSSLFLPEPQRSLIWAIRAMNVELAHIQQKGKELGKIRFEWWKNAVLELFEDRPPEHPVLLALREHLQRQSIAKSWFLRLISEREKSLSIIQYPNVKSLEQYAENTSSTLLYMQLEAFNIKSAEADHAASHIGKAVGISTILQGLPHAIQHQQFFLPSDICAKHGISAEQVIRGKVPLETLSDAVHEVATTAHHHVLHGCDLMKDKPENFLPLFTSCPSIIYLKELENVNFNPFLLTRRNWKLPFTLWRRYGKGKLL